MRDDDDGQRLYNLRHMDLNNRAPSQPRTYNQTHPESSSNEQKSNQANNPNFQRQQQRIVEPSEKKDKYIITELDSLGEVSIAPEANGGQALIPSHEAFNKALEEFKKTYGYEPRISYSILPPKTRYEFRSREDKGRFLNIVQDKMLAEKNTVSADAQVGKSVSAIAEAKREEREERKQKDTAAEESKQEEKGSTSSDNNKSIPLWRNNTTQQPTAEKGKEKKLAPAAKESKQQEEKQPASSSWLPSFLSRG